MLKQYFLLFFLLSSNVSCEKSFTIVMDTTKSMEYEIYAFKTHIASIVNVIRSSTFTNYILIPFGHEGKPLTKTAFFFSIITLFCLLVIYVIYIILYKYCGIPS